MHAVILFGAGVLGGLTGSIAGLASVATYPALLAVGLPPVAANVTNTVALAPGGELLIDVLATPDGSEHTRIRLARADGSNADITLSVDRSESRSLARLPRYDAKLLSGVIPAGESGEVELRILVDHSIIEIYANGRPLTARAYPASAQSNSIVVETHPGASINELSTWEMAAAEQSERFSIIPTM